MRYRESSFRFVVAAVAILSGSLHCRMLSADSFDEEGVRQRVLAAGARSSDVLFLLKAPGLEILNKFASRITKVGGLVVYSESRLGYVHAVVPLAAYEHLKRDRSVLAFRYDGDSVPNRSTNLYRGRAGSISPTWPTYEELNQMPAFDLSKLRIGSPDVPATYLGIEEWVRRHPTFDGRGTTIANVEVFG